MSWHDEYPHKIYQQVLLSAGKIIDWRIGNGKKERLTWTMRFNIPKNEGLMVETNVIEVNNQDEHNEAFNNKKWFEQFEYHDKFSGVRL